MTRLLELVLDILEIIDDGETCPETFCENCQNDTEASCDNNMDRHACRRECWQKYIEQELRYMKEPPEEEYEEFHTLTEGYLYSPTEEEEEPEIEVKMITAKEAREKALGFKTREAKQHLEFIAGNIKLKATDGYFSTTCHIPTTISQEAKDTIKRELEIGGYTVEEESFKGLGKDIWELTISWPPEGDASQQGDERSE